MAKKLGMVRVVDESGDYAEPRIMRSCVATGLPVLMIRARGWFGIRRASSTTYFA